MTLYEDFVNDYLVKNGMAVSQNNLNKAPEQLKKEIDELQVLVSSNSSIGTLAEFKLALEQKG